jgi:general secretion pathway protein L
VSNTIWAQIPTHGDGAWVWIDSSQRSAAQVETGTVAELAAAARGRRLALLAPPSAVTLHTATLPLRGGDRLRAALPYALEDNLLSEVEDLHFAHGQRFGDHQWPVAVVSRQQMGDWLAPLATRRVEGIWFAAQLLPWQAGEWSLWMDDEWLLLRYAQNGAIAVPVAEIEAWLAPLLATETPQQIRLWLPPQQTPPPLFDAIPCSVVEAPCLLALIASQPPDRQAINLLQGEFGQRDQWQRLWRSWRVAALLLLIWGGLLLAMEQWALTGLQQQLQQLQQEGEAIYRETFPAARRVVNPRVQMEQQLAQLRQGGGRQAGFSSLLTRSAPALAKGAEVQVRTLRYRSGALELELTVRDLPALDSLKQQLAQTGLLATIQSAINRPQGGVEARLEIREVTP